MVRRWYAVVPVVGLAILASSLSGLPASAVEPAPTVVAYGAPDGVLLEWPSQDYYVRQWRITRSTGGASTTLDVSTASSYSDTALLPGQAATYTVAALDGGTPGPASLPVSAARGASAWVAPAGASTWMVDGDQESWSTPSPMRSDSVTLGRAFDGFTGLAYPYDWAFGRIPGPGSYRLGPTADASTVAFRDYCAQGTATGQVTVHDIVYAADGVPVEFGADFAWACGDGLLHRRHIRYFSPAPMPHVVLEHVGEAPAVVRGHSATDSWRLRNDGSSAATVGALDALSGYAGLSVGVDPVCDGVTLAPGGSCDLTVRIATTADLVPWPSGYGFEVRGTVAGQPGAVATGSVAVYGEVTAPSIQWLARTTDAVALRLDVPGAADMAPGAQMVIERETDSGPWTEVHRQAASGFDWTDTSVSVGSKVAYRARTVDAAGTSSLPSGSVSGVMPTDAVLGLGAVDAIGSGNHEDPEWVALPRPSGAITSGVAVSPDRRHLAVATYDDATGTAWLFLTDRQGGSPTLLARSVDQRMYGRPRFSPDGGRIAYTDGSALGLTVALVDIASGAVTHLASQGVPYGWSPDGTSLLLGGGMTASGGLATGLRWTKVAGEASTPVAGSSAVQDENSRLSTSVAVSRTGDVVWVDADSAGGTLRRAAGGTVTTLWAPTGCRLGEPAWSPSAGKLAVQVSGAACIAGPSGAVALDVPVSGTGTSWTPMSAVAPKGPAWVATADAAPTSTATVPPVTGSAATITVTGGDTDDAVGGLSYSCSLDSGAWQACSTSWRPSGLAAGPHSAAVVSVDPAGRRSQPANLTWTVDRTAPAVTMGSLPGVLLGTGLTVGWTGKDSGGGVVASYDVRRRYALLGGGWSAYSYPAGWQGRRTAGLPVVLTPGVSYCFSVRARDSVGNVGAFSAERCVSVALDDRALAVRGGVRGTTRAAFDGTFTKVTGTSQYLSRTGVAGRRIGLVVTRCSTCAPLDVWVGGVKVGRLSTYASSTRYRQQVWLPSFTRTRSGTVVVRPASSRAAYVDGLVVLK